MTENALRAGLVEVSQRIVALGLNRGTSGNASVRCGEGFLVTPSALPVDEMKPEDLVLMDMEGKVRGAGKPSSEWRFHCDVLAKRSDVGALIHTHSPFATTLACLRKEVPSLHYMIAVTGGDTIRCAPYALFGEQALSDHALLALEDRKACLLANHGMIALGKDANDALAVTIEVEFLCELYWRALQVGEPHVLTPQQMQDVQNKFVGYRKRDS